MSTAATVKHLDPTQVELEIAIPEHELAAARDRAFQSLVKNARIPGFRPGKVPRRIFEAQYGTAGIEERAMDTVVPIVYGRALEEHALDPVDRPQLELVPSEPGEPLRLRATVAIRPAFVPAPYLGIELSAPSALVTEAELDAALEALRKDQAMLVPVERPVALGDTPTLDYIGTIDGVAFAGGSAENAPTEIIAERFIPGFADGIVGMSAGETKEVEAHFPADYSNAELAGKTALFTVTVVENKVAELPDLDDDFARRFGRDDATLADLRVELRRRLEAQKSGDRHRALTNALIAHLVASNDVPVPAVLVEREAQNLLDEAKSYVARAGSDWEAYLASQERTEDELRATYRPEAERRVRATFVIEAIARQEKIVATDADVEAEIAQMVTTYGQPREAILQMLRPNFNALVDGIVRTKTIEFLLERAAVAEAMAQPADVEATIAPSA